MSRRKYLCSCIPKMCIFTSQKNCDQVRHCTTSSLNIWLCILHCLVCLYSVPFSFPPFLPSSPLLPMLPSLLLPLLLTTLSPLCHTPTTPSLTPNPLPSSSQKWKFCVGDRKWCTDTFLKYLHCDEYCSRAMAILLNICTVWLLNYKNI